MVIYKTNGKARTLFLIVFPNPINNPNIIPNKMDAIDKPIVNNIPSIDKEYIQSLYPDENP